MKFRTAFATLSVLVSIVAFGCAEESAIPQSERIVSFSSDILANIDNSIDVVETIVYDGGQSSHHGILRDIRTTSSSGVKMNIDILSVKDETGQSVEVSQSRTPGELSLRIGDPDVTFTGRKTYVISYHATHAVDQRKDIDELYWNVTGNNWPFPIEYSEASIHMPASAIGVQSSCYMGATGSTHVCDHSEKISDTETYFRAGKNLNSQEGLTVAVGVHKGAFAPYTKGDDFAAMMYEWRGVGVILTVFVFVFAVLFVRWRKYGRDPQGKDTVVPQYDMPQGLSVLDMDVLRTQQLGLTAISAHIVELAVAGCIRIEELSAKDSLTRLAGKDNEDTVGNMVGAIEAGTGSLLSRIVGKGYVLHKLDKASPFLCTSSQKLLELLFAGGKTSVSLRELPADFPQKVLSLMDDERAFMLENGYYSNLPKASKGAIFAIVIAVFFAFQILPSAVSGMGSWFPTPLTVMVAVVCMILLPLMVLVFQGLMPAKTVKGIEMKAYFDGLLLYISKAEKARIEFHNAPEKRPELFDKLLPAAMALGVTKIWAKEFEGIYMTPPDWYQGNTFESGFSASLFANSLESFSQATNQAVSPSSSGGSGGSGGGGSSGGGGGGGGGGSW